jgi:8-amino-7-oxononanoate synthase
MDDDLADRRRNGLYRRRRYLQSGQGTRVRLRGREVVNFASNDYLSLASDPRLARAAARAARRYGCGSGASPLVSGFLPPLRRLEKALAEWEATEAALVFSSGFAANLAAVSVLAGRQDAVFSDERNHASLIDGCRLSRATVHIYRHVDLQHLDELLKIHAPNARRRLIVTDTVFSMDGDVAPLVGLIELAAHHDCQLLLDEAHATGVLGDTGRGAIELLPAECSFDCDRLVRVGTLSKALGSQGGFISGSKRLCAWLVNHARPYIFSTALAVPAAAAARRAVTIVQTEPQRRQHLQELVALLRIELRAAGFAAPEGITPIVPLIAGDAAAAVQLSTQLELRGLLVPAIRPPSVPEGTSRLRITLTAGHNKADVYRLIEALTACTSRGLRQHS